jgi:hypothetical protein
VLGAQAWGFPERECFALPDGLSSTLRLPGHLESELPEEQDVEIGEADGDAAEHLDADGNLLSITFPDGSIEINLNGALGAERTDLPPPGWFENLCERIGPMILGLISESIMRGIEEDEDSRKGWLEDRANGIKLLGLKLNVPGVGGSVEGAPVEGMSTVRHPLLAQGVLNFQANARSEMLPTDGPAKIRDDSNNVTPDEDDLAEALEKDLNHYLTVTAKEYYPDTDRMLIPLSLGGTSFKKVYYCPIRQRPVSETVDATDLIVNDSVTDLQNAKRVTHRIMMPPNTVKRMQILGVYRDVPLSTPQEIDLNAVDREVKEQQGISQSGSFNPDDRDREIYECYCELNIPGLEHKKKGAATGLEVPYRVTIDKTSRQILALVRDYNKDTEDLPERRQTFVKYTFIPGFGFWDIGYLNILGNTTNALTAAWRECLDAGMFASFPGFLMSDAGGRQNTNIFRIPPGGGQVVKTGGAKIGDAVMPLPYKDASPGLLKLIELMDGLGQRMAGVATLQVGEGKADMPVGTILAIIEQSTKVENAIHKRMHAAQAEELQLLVECFREHPESFWQRNKRPARKWDQDLFLRAINTYDLIPQADPNTSSHTQRIMKAVALKQLAQLNPPQYDMAKIDAKVMKTIGYSQPEQYFAPAGTPNPQVQFGQGKLAIEDKKANAALISAQANAKKAQQGLSAGKTPEEMALEKQKLALSAQGQQFTQQRAGIEDQNRDQDRQADLLKSSMGLEKEVLQQDREHAHDRQQQGAEHSHDLATQLIDQASQQEKQSPNGDGE